MQPIPQGPSDPLPEPIGAFRRARLDLDSQLGHGSSLIHLDAELGHLVEAAKDTLYRRREHVVAANDDHIVASTQNPALHPGERPPAGARPAGQPHLIPGTISNQGASEAAQIGQHQFTDLALGHGLIAVRVDQFGDELAFDHVHPAWSLDTLEPPRADLRHPRVIEDSRSPGRLDTGPGGWNITAGFAGDDQHAHR